MKTIKLYYEIVMEQTIRRIIRQYKFKKRLKELRKKDPFIYK